MSISVQPISGSSRRRGASIQSWRATSPRALLDHLYERNPEFSRDQLLKRFEECVRERDDFIKSIIEYWFTNNYNSLLRLRESAIRERGGVGLGTSPEVVAVREKAAREARETITKAVEKRARLMLLDMVMLNGKRLRACTGEECRVLSKTAGRWLAAIAREVGAKKKVGEVLSEDRLHELYEAAA